MICSFVLCSVSGIGIDNNSIQCTSWWGAGMVICLRRGADMHMAQLIAILIVGQMQEKFRRKRKKLYFGFVDVEKAFDRVPREMIRWPMRKFRVDE